jgi:AraC-like DNA-binding protein
MRIESYLEKPDFSVENLEILAVIRGENYRHSYRNGRIKHGFIYVETGCWECLLLSNSLNPIWLNQGEMLFVPAGTAYEGIYRQDNTCIRIVQFHLATGQLPEYLTQPVKLVLPGIGEVIENFFYPEGDHVFYHLACFYRLLWQVSGGLTMPPAKYRRLQAALKRIAENPAENVKVEEYAALCGMSEVNFRRLFGAYTGKSPIDYRNDLRLQRARGLLQSGEYTVSETAELCGFSNLSFFIRLFKKKYGHTPKQLD